MKKQKFILVVMVLLFASCEKESFRESKKDGFDSPEEYLENPSVKNAIDESGMPVYEGDNPPVLSGVYSAEGEVVSASSDASELEGLPLRSTITLYDQTASGKIKIKEEVQGIVVYGAGGYIIGDDGKFSIFEESYQSGEEAGLPSDLSINVVLVMSGKKYSNGNLKAKGISIVTKASSTNSGKYDLEAIENLWWMWEADFYLEGAAKNFRLENEESFYFSAKLKRTILNCQIQKPFSD